MAKPRKNTREWIEDYFAEMSVNDQAIMLRVLSALHRRATRTPGVQAEMFEQQPEAEGEAE
jgi:hypothetical protein